jgi:hypothetical protein
MPHLPARAAALALVFGLTPLAPLAAPGGQVLNGRQQFVDQNGQPIVGGAVYLYQVGTTTPVATYQDANLSIPNSAPVILDSRGQAAIWVAPGNYREQVYDGSGNLIWDQTTSSSNAAVALNPGATVATNGDVTGTPTLFNGVSAISIPTTVVSATTAVAGKVQLTTAAVAQAGASSAQAVTPAALAAVVQGQSQTYVLDTGAPGALVVAPTPAWTAYVAGAVVQVKLANALAGAATINVSGLGAKTIQVNGANPIQTLPAGQIVTLTYDGTYFQTGATAPTLVRGYITGCSTGTCTVAGGTGINSVTRIGIGHYTVNFANPFPNTNFTTLCTFGDGAQPQWVCIEDTNTARTASSVTLEVTSGSLQENGSSTLNILVIGNP